MINKELQSIVDEGSKAFEEISDMVWEYAEIQFREHRSTELQREYMRSRGFRITAPLGGLDTAFMAEYGQGSPVIAFLGENDALSGQSQAADAFERRPVTAGGAGHACGHNLLGTGSMEAACALREYMERHHLQGTLRYYACPAEEGGGGKVLLCQAGAFDGVDAALTWHPGSENKIGNGGIACVTARFRFTGRAAHAAGEPWNGRSALDAVELMNVGTQFLREHMRPTDRVHYAITDAGGDAPNVVQHSATVLYVARSHDNGSAQELFGRIKDIAAGAALMTGTVLEPVEIVSAYANRIANTVMDRLMVRNMREQLPIAYTEDELDYAAKYVPFGSMPAASPPMDDGLDERTDRPPMMGSTDLADVSWHVPLGECDVASCARGTSGHTWMFTAQGKSSVAHKGMHTAAKIMASAALELLSDPELLEMAGAEHRKSLGGRKYTSLMPPRRVE